jgi:hypothetical protein
MINSNLNNGPANRFNATFAALLKESEFTNEMLGSGATYIRKATYASKGVYFQAFTNLSTGLERIGKLCLMLDHYLTNNGDFPDLQYMKCVIGHKLRDIYQKSQGIALNRSITFAFCSDLSDPIHRAILDVISNFAEGDRYSNIDLLVGSRNQRDPLAAWVTNVDELIFNKHIALKKKSAIKLQAELLAANSMPSAVSFTSETGDDILNVCDMLTRSANQNAVAPYRQLYVLQIIRYWVELLSALQFQAMRVNANDIPHLNEVFRMFNIADTGFRSRKVW